MSKELFSLIAIFLTFAGYLPYIYSIKKGKTKPHIFSWIIWGITTFIVFLAQLEDKGGVGAWPLGLSGIITIYVAILAYTKKSDTSITKGRPEQLTHHLQFFKHADTRQVPKLMVTPLARCLTK